VTEREALIALVALEPDDELWQKGLPQRTSKAGLHAWDAWNRRRIEALKIGQALASSNLELQPRFELVAFLDGDDWPPTMTGNLEYALTDALEEIKRQGLMIDYTLTRDGQSVEVAA
jgi:hypothetical protein